MKNLKFFNAVCFRPGSYSATFFLTVFVLIFTGSVCKSQLRKTDNKLNSNINFNALINSESEQLLLQVKCDQIAKYIDLSAREKKILTEIKLLFAEGKQCLKDADRVDNEIGESLAYVYNSDELISRNIRNERKIKRQENCELSFRYDAEELFEIANRLLFKIYEAHYSTVEVLNSSQGSERQKILDLYNEAHALYSKAKISEDIAQYNLDYNTGLDYLKKSNYLIRESIKKFEQIFSIVDSIPVIKVVNTTLFVKSEIIPKIKEVKVGTIIKPIKTPIITVFGSGDTKKDTDSKFPKLNEMIVYKVQVGAFAQKINVNEFHGLVPLTEDNTDQKKYTKFMVGKYYSYKAATKAKNIITATTKYSDAFVVAYKNGKRVVIDNNLLNPKEISLID